MATPCVTFDPVALRAAISARGLSHRQFAFEARLPTSTLTCALASRPVSQRTRLVIAEALAKLPVLDDAELLADSAAPRS
jgi:lambda repressor-like predicted transcriptional regulator